MMRLAAYADVCSLSHGVCTLSELGKARLHANAMLLNGEYMLKCRYVKVNDLA